VLSISGANKQACAPLPISQRSYTSQSQPQLLLPLQTGIEWNLLASATKTQECECESMCILFCKIFSLEICRDVERSEVTTQSISRIPYHQLQLVEAFLSHYETLQIY
jgi:hypothetical protein